MSESNLDPYHGILNPFQIAAGLRAAKASAQRLLDDARHLYDIRSYPSATALGVLCIEEIGKLPVLRRMALAKTAQEWRQCWRDFSNHLAKSAHWIVPFLLGKGHTFESFAASFSQDKDPDDLNSLKQLGFYVGCYGRAHWSEPQAVIEKPQADLVLGSAEVVVLGSSPSELDTPTAMQLWTDRMSGCFSCDAVTANNRVVAFLEQARAEGIRLDGQGIPKSVAFEFMSTVLYISGNG